MNAIINTIIVVSIVISLLLFTRVLPIVAFLCLVIWVLYKYFKATDKTKNNDKKTL